MQNDRVEAVRGLGLLHGHPPGWTEAEGHPGLLSYPQVSDGNQGAATQLPLGSHSGIQGEWVGVTKPPLITTMVNREIGK